MKIIALTILAVLSGHSIASEMTMAPDAVFVQSITEVNQINHGVALNFMPGEGSECLLKINILDTYGSKKVRLNINQRNLESKSNITIGIEQKAAAGHIFGVVALNKNHLTNSELDIIMYKSGNITVFHGNAQLSNFSACKF